MSQELTGTASTSTSTGSPPARYGVGGQVAYCRRCGSEDVQWTAWVSVNTGALADSEPPTDQAWCPECEDDEVELDWRTA